MTCLSAVSAGNSFKNEWADQKLTCWHGFLGEMPSFRPSGTLAAESSNALTWISQSLRGWTARDWVVTPEALSKTKQMSSVIPEPQRTNRPIPHTHKSVYASADVRELFM